MWAHYLDNVRSSTPYNPIGLHGLLRGKLHPLLKSPLILSHVTNYHLGHRLPWLTEFGSPESRDLMRITTAPPLSSVRIAGPLSTYPHQLSAWLLKTLLSNPRKCKHLCLDLPSSFLPSAFRNKTTECLHFTMRATCSAHITLVITTVSNSYRSAHMIRLPARLISPPCVVHTF
jgi:hypothetical protein